MYKLTKYETLNFIVLIKSLWYLTTGINTFILLAYEKIFVRSIFFSGVTYIISSIIYYLSFHQAYKLLNVGQILKTFDDEISHI